MDLDARKLVLKGLQTTMAQTSLSIRADWSEPLLFTFWKVSYQNLPQAKFLFSSFSLYSVAAEAGLSLALSDTPKTGFVA